MIFKSLIHLKSSTFAVTSGSLCRSAVAAIIESPRDIFFVCRKEIALSIMISSIGINTIVCNKEPNSFLSNSFKLWNPNTSSLEIEEAEKILSSKKSPKSFFWEMYIRVVEKFILRYAS